MENKKIEVQLQKAYDNAVAAIVAEAKKEGGNLEQAVLLISQQFEQIDKGSPLFPVVAEARRALRTEYEEAKRAAVTRSFDLVEYHQVKNDLQDQWFRVLLALIYQNKGKLQVSTEAAMWAGSLSPVEKEHTSIEVYDKPGGHELRIRGHHKNSNQKG